MRVLIIVESGGGVARHIVDLIKGFQKKSLDITLVYSSVRMDIAHLKEIERLQKFGLVAFRIDMRRSPSICDILVLFKLLKIAYIHGPFDLVHGHSSKGGVMARLIAPLIGAKSIYTAHAFYTMSPGLRKLKFFLVWLAEFLLGRLGDAVIATSKQELTHAISVIKIPNSVVHLIYNGSDRLIPQTGEVDEFRSKCKIDRAEFIIGFVGRFEYQKAPENLIRAFAGLDLVRFRARLVMVGDGSLKLKLQDLARNLGVLDSVEFPGLCASAVAMEVFDVFVLPSRYEGSPYVLHDAALAALPIISTAVGGTDILVQDQINGRVIQHGVSLLLSALEDILLDPSCAIKMGIESQKLIAKYPITRMVDETIQLYTSLLNPNLNLKGLN
jgi:glycosyltransferase involved in cell wall biosynthesis